MPGGPGVRVDSHLFEGYRVPPYYDSLIAKLIVWGQDRDEAIERMRRALSEMRIEGVHTTRAFHLRLLDDARFRRGDVHTRFVEEELMESATQPWRVLERREEADARSSGVVEHRKKADA